MARRPGVRRRRYYDPGSQPQPRRPVRSESPATVAKLTRQQRRKLAREADKGS